MPKTLVIVESPSKGRTISRFLGNNFVVESSFGHIRDLPTSKLGVDVEHNFEPQYLIPAKARANVKKLKSETAKAEKVILATDEDREGEAIAWHLVQALGLNESSQPTTHDSQQEGKKSKKPKAESRKLKAVAVKPKAAIARIVFHEITERAIKEAMAHPRKIDMPLVDAQQARRVLDRLVGYKLSPFLWKKMYRGLSAGRVQSVAMRIIVEREREIEKFKPEEYWSLEAVLRKATRTDTNRKDTRRDFEQEFTATLAKINGKQLDKFGVKNQKEADAILENLENASWIVENVEKKAVTRNPLPPHTTSTLQQDAFRRLGFSAKQTMRLAQQLYEGIQLGEGSIGLISYMRTDSLNLSQDSLDAATGFIKGEFGDKYILPAPRRFKTKSKGAQEAHEAIRPTDPMRAPDSIKEFLDPRQFKLYTLIWQRFIATQMPPAVFDATTVDITPTTYNLQPTTYLFRASGQIMKFDGFLKVYPMKFTETELPELEPKEELDLQELKPLQHFTEPPPRFSEATLVKTLEKYGIGRPSTYAPIISTIQDRGYVEKHERRYLKPTETGFLVNDILVEHFPKIVDLQFTAKMEEELDEIAEGKKEWQPVIRAFYEPFAKNLEAKYEEVKKHEIAETTDEVCEKCGKPMVIKMGRFGKFLACSGFPDCKNAKPLGKKEPPQTIGMRCPKCVEGDVIIRRTKRGKIFYGCSRYPQCDWASWEDPRKPAEEKK
ncbi:MAG: DNA topoisomerase I [Parcubacteria group bacterium Gr01-1014_33]|nr:MAG: DNA topoisomerase I [Parcubacteria group bacterium Gr01-1014_33]